jgi:hypothetical protein
MASHDVALHYVPNSDRGIASVYSYTVEGKIASTDSNDDDTATVVGDADNSGNALTSYEIIAPPLPSDKGGENRTVTSAVDANESVDDRNAVV